MMITKKAAHTTLTGGSPKGGQNRMSESTEMFKERIEAIARQDVALAKSETKHAVKTFQHKLWMRLQVDFMDIPTSTAFERLKKEKGNDKDFGYSKLEIILIKRLQEMRVTLQEMEVAPK
jgi:hypothetical protein